jgi:glycerate kinase
MSAAEVAAAMAAGLQRAGLEVDEMPLADGGDGTMEVLVDAFGGEVVAVPATDPLGRRIEARFAVLADRRAVVEVAAASGLTLVATAERDAWAATSRGTGELIASAAAAGAETVLVAAGGSATTDGGLAAVEAVREAGARVRLTVLCDVRAPFERAAGLFGPQKGADARTVARLEARLDELAARAPRDPASAPDASLHFAFDCKASSLVTRSTPGPLGQKREVTCPEARTDFSPVGPDRILVVLWSIDRSGAVTVLRDTVRVADGPLQAAR